MTEVTIVVEDVDKDESLESPGPYDEDEEDISEISDRDEDGLSFEGMQLAVKEVNTKILSYPDLVHIELSSSCESLSGNNLLKEQKQLGLCRTVLTRSYENFNFNKNNNNNKNKNNNNRDHFCWMTTSCPDLSQTCCSTHEHDRLQNDNTEDGESRRESEDFVNITINEHNNKNNENFNDDFSDSDDETEDMFDCINIIGLFRSLATQKHKPSKLSRTMSQPDLRTIKQSTKKTPYDFNKLQTVVNQWTNKVLDLDLMKSCNWGMEMSNVVGDVLTVKEIKEGKQVQCVVGCIPSIIF